MSTDLRAWKIRAEVDSASSILKIQRGIISVDYGITGLAVGLDRTKIETAVRSSYVDSSKNRIAAHVSQIFTLLNRISPNDLLVIPTNKGKDIFLGEVSRGAFVRGTCIEIEASTPLYSLSVSSFSLDLRYSFMAIMKVCEVSRNDAASRLAHALLCCQNGETVGQI
jgi:predicted Mrr-cat superfamily restriction endonuclease